MMTTTTATTLSKDFTSSELVILQKLYRSRSFQYKINSQTITTDNVILIYGSINTLSASQRALFRQYTTKIDLGSEQPIVKLSLFSNSVSKTIIDFSSFAKLKNLFKGTTYELENSIKVGKVPSIFVVRSSCLEHLKKLQFSEDISFNFTPSLIRVVNGNGQITPRRITNQQISVFSQQHVIRQQLINTIESSCTQII